MSHRHKLKLSRLIFLLTWRRIDLKCSTQNKAVLFLLPVEFLCVTCFLLHQQVRERRCGIARKHSHGNFVVFQNEKATMRMKMQRILAQVVRN